MRKRLKQKRRSCGLCKPHKRCWSNRNTPRQDMEQRIAEREIRERGRR